MEAVSCVWESVIELVVVWNLKACKWSFRRSIARRLLICTLGGFTGGAKQGRSAPLLFPLIGQDNTLIGPISRDCQRMFRSPAIIGNFTRA